MVELAKDSELDSVAQKARKKFKPLTVFTGGLHKAWTIDLQATWRPGLKYSIRNGRKFALNETAPQITLTYNKSIPTSLSAAEFELVSLGISHTIQFGVSGKLDFNIQAGSFFNNRNVYFMDYQHFGGNRTIFSNILIT